MESLGSGRGCLRYLGISGVLCGLTERNQAKSGDSALTVRALDFKQQEAILVYLSRKKLYQNDLGEVKK